MMSNFFRRSFLFFLLLPQLTYANAELDRRYALETVGILKAWDNVDGLFETYVNQAFEEVFVKQTRFVLHDLSKANEIIGNSKIPYYKIIQDHQILAQVSRSTKSHSIIRTKITKSGSSYRFSIDWMHAPSMDIIANETFDTENVGDVKSSLAAGLQRLIDKIPFKGQVTGRDNDSVTINLGTQSQLGLKSGDVLVISTLDAVKKHPLLKEIVEWKLTPIGKVQVEQVDEAITFCKVIEQEPGRSIARYQKVTQLIPYVEPKPEMVSTDEPRPGELNVPSLGYVSGGLLLGSYGRDYSTSNSSTRFSGSGLAYGPRAQGQLWLTKNWFVDWALAYHLWSYSQTDTNTGLASSAGSVSANLFKLRFGVGYSYLLNGTLFGPKGWIKLNYSSHSYSFPSSSTEATTPISFRSLVLGLGGELPVREVWAFGLNFDFGLFPSATEDPILSANNSVSSARDISIEFSGLYWLNSQLRFKVGIDFTTQGADFGTGSSLSQKIITITPTLMYYF